MKEMAVKPVSEEGFPQCGSARSLGHGEGPVRQGGKALEKDLR